MIYKFKLQDEDAPAEDAPVEADVPGEAPAEEEEAPSE